MGIETAWILLPPAGWVLWGIGGTWWKPARRFVYPLVLGVALASLGLSFWRSLLVASCSSLVFSLGYGEGKTWLDRLAVGAAYGMSLLWIQVAWWVPVLTTVQFAGMMWASRRWGRFTWKIVEGSTGGLHAALAVWLASSVI